MEGTRKTQTLFVISTLLIVLMPGWSEGADYLSDLKVAAQKVARMKEDRASRAGALSVSRIVSLLGRPYRKGDRWEVIAWQFDNSIARKMTEDGPRTETARAVGAFRYEVTETTIDSSSVTVQVRQIPAYGLDIVDPNVESLTVSTTSELGQTTKKYEFKNRASALPASTNGLRVAAAFTSLDLFPLDVPELRGALHRRASLVPDLPEFARVLASRIGFSPNPAQSTWYEQDDFFGRPVEVLWQMGDPWPAYLRSSQGIAILANKNLSGGDR